MVRLHFLNTAEIAPLVTPIIALGYANWRLFGCDTCH